MLSRRGEYKVRQCLYWRAADIRASNQGSRRLHEVKQFSRFFFNGLKWHKMHFKHDLIFFHIFSIFESVENDPVRTCI